MSTAARPKTSKARPAPTVARARGPTPAPEGVDAAKWTMALANLAYFASEFLTGDPEPPYHGHFVLGAHHLEWSQAVRKHRRLCLLAARDHGKSFMFTMAYPIWMATKYPGRLGLILSASDDLALELLAKIIEQVEMNPKLSYLLPESGRLGSSHKIRFANGHIIKARGFTSKLRGGHPLWCVLDDALDDDSMTSEIARQKSVELYHSRVRNMVVPTGQIIVVGCVAWDTWVQTAAGLRQIGRLLPVTPASSAVIRAGGIERVGGRSVPRGTIGERENPELYPPPALEAVAPGTLLPFDPGPVVSDRRADDRRVMGRVGLGAASHFFVNGEGPALRLDLERGFELTGSPIHPVIRLSTAGLGEWVKLPDLRAGDRVQLRIGTGLGGLRASILSDAPTAPTVVLSDAPTDQSHPVLFNDRRTELSDDRRARRARRVLRPVTEAELTLLGAYAARGAEYDGGFDIALRSEDAWRWMRDFLASDPTGIAITYGPMQRLKVRARRGFRVGALSGDVLRLEGPGAARFRTLVDQFLPTGWGPEVEGGVPRAVMEGDEVGAVAFLRGVFGIASQVAASGAGATDPSDPRHRTVPCRQRTFAKDLQILLLHLGIVISRYSFQKKAYLRATQGYADALGALLSDAPTDQQNSALPDDRREDVHCALSDDRREERRGPRGAGLLEVPAASVSAGAVPRWKRLALRAREQDKMPYHSTELVTAPSGVVEHKGILRKNMTAERRALLLADDALWLKVKGVSATRALTVDFVIPPPGDHSFLSGGVVSHNTPFHRSDLYANLKETPGYYFKKFPAIFLDKDGTRRALWPERYSLALLEERLEEIKAMRFTREFLVEPISDSSSLFPDHYFRGETVERKDRLFAQDWRYWEDKGITERYIGVDVSFGSAAKQSTDYMVVFVIGLDKHRNRWIIDIVRDRNISFGDQLQKIKRAARRYRPTMIYIESNQAQRVWGQELIQQTDLPLRPFFTGENKHSLEKGVPSLAVLLENQKIRIPRGSTEHYKLIESWIDEMKSFTVKDGQAISVGEHDDMAMAFWIANACAADSHFTFAFGEEEGDAEALDALEADLWGGVDGEASDARDRDDPFGGMMDPDSYLVGDPEDDIYGPMLASAKNAVDGRNHAGVKLVDGEYDVDDPNVEALRRRRAEAKKDWRPKDGAPTAEQVLGLPSGYFAAQKRNRRLG